MRGGAGRIGTLNWRIVLKDLVFGNVAGFFGFIGGMIQSFWRLVPAASATGCGFSERRVCGAAGGASGEEVEDTLCGSRVGRGAGVWRIGF